MTSYFHTIGQWPESSMTLYLEEVRQVAAYNYTVFGREFII